MLQGEGCEVENDGSLGARGRQAKAELKWSSRRSVWSVVSREVDLPEDRSEECRTPFQSPPKSTWASSALAAARCVRR